MSTATIADNKTVIAAFFERLNAGRVTGPRIGPPICRRW